LPTGCQVPFPPIFFLLLLSFSFVSIHFGGFDVTILDDGKAQKWIYTCPLRMSVRDLFEEKMPFSLLGWLRVRVLGKAKWVYCRRLVTRK
jgi:hypothetical protein